MFASFGKLLHNVRFSRNIVSNSYVYLLLVYYPFSESLEGLEVYANLTFFVNE